MAALKLVQQSKQNVQIGYVGFGMRRARVETPAQSAHDGDTVIVRALANMSIRFLGVDTPEISFQLPGTRAFVAIADPRWITFLTDPLAAWKGDAVPRALRDHLRPRLGPTAAPNHARHAQGAKERLAGLIEADLGTFFGGDPEKFVFFLLYAHDVLDRYGRLLAYINPSVLDKEKRPELTYNERMLREGLATPYFIWPNTDPFKREPTVLDAVFSPAQAAKVGSEGRLGDARRWVREARAAHRGVFDRADPLALEPFELRYLAGGRLPDRAVVDLSGGHKRLVRATEYFRVEHPEDRLYIPSEFVKLFQSAGW